MVGRWERSGIPIGWSIDGANRNDVVMLGPALDSMADNGLLGEVGTLTLDRSYDYPKIRSQLHARELVELDIQRRGTSPRLVPRTGSPLGCAGLLRPPAPGGRTTASSAAKPTVRSGTATLPSNSPPLYSSSADSSTTATDGARTGHLLAQVVGIIRTRSGFRGTSGQAQPASGLG